jgi:hypothetical protein
MTITRWKCVALALIVMLAGPYASWLSVAEAQQRQTMDNSGSILTSSGAMEGPHTTAGDNVAAGFMNVVYVPGKVAVCTLGTAATIGLLLVTLGFAYHAAANVFKEGCGGDWVLTGDHISGVTPTPTYDYMD